MTKVKQSDIYLAIATFIVILIAYITVISFLYTKQQDDLRLAHEQVKHALTLNDKLDPLCHYNLMIDSSASAQLQSTGFIQMKILEVE